MLVHVKTHRVGWANRDAIVEESGNIVGGLERDGLARPVADADGHWPLLCIHQYGVEAVAITHGRYLQLLS